MFDFIADVEVLFNILNINMGLEPGESVLLLNDVPGIKDWRMPPGKVIDFLSRSVIVRQMYDFYQERFKENDIRYETYLATGQHGAEPPVGVARLMESCDVILAITTYSLSHTEARAHASSQGARIASMPRLRASMLLQNGPMAVDYDSMITETLYLTELLDHVATARLETKDGTRLTFSLKGRKGGADTGILTGKGQWGNLPGGETCVAPVEGTAEGVLVVPVGWYENLDQAMVLEFSGGYVSAISGGGKVGDYFRELLKLSEESFKHRRNCAELGIGTNPNAKDALNVLEAEKIRGTVHIAIGDSYHLGGFTQSDLHEDFIIPKPTLYLDDTVVIKEGLLEV